MHPDTPHKATIVIDCFFGWPLNDFNDLEVLNTAQRGEAVSFVDAVNFSNNQKQTASKYVFTRTFRFIRTKHTYCLQLQI